MKRPAVFFDRDNTLIVSDGYLGDPDRVVLVDGAADAVARVRGMGFAAVVFSNQSGVARGLFGEEAVYAVNHRLDELLHEDNPSAVIDRHEFCPYHTEATVERYRRDSELRKPKPGMILRAHRKLDLDLSQSWVIGDAPRDVAAGLEAGLRTILLKVPDLPPSEAANEPLDVKPHFVAASLQEAVDLIERHRTTESADESPAQASAAPVAASVDQSVERTSVSGPDAVSETDAGDEPVKTTAALAPPQPGMTWGERMRAAKAHGLLPSRPGNDAGEAPLASGRSSAASDEAPGPAAPVPQPPAEPPAATAEPSTVVAAPETPGVKDVPVDVPMAPESPIAAPAAASVEVVEVARPIAVAPFERTAAATPAEPAVTASEPAPAKSAAASPIPFATPARESQMASPETSADVPVETPVKTAVDTPVTSTVETPATANAAADSLAGANGARSASPTPPASDVPAPSLARLIELSEQILQELRRDDDLDVGDFSVAKLIAGIGQVVTVAALILAAVNRTDKGILDSLLLTAIAFQTLTIALLIMGKQK